MEKLWAKMTSKNQKAKGKYQKAKVGSGRRFFNTKKMLSG
jgi:hypothetical protein